MIKEVVYKTKGRKSKCLIIWLNKYYIVDTLRRDQNFNMVMLKKPFDNKRQAQMAIDKCLNKSIRFGVIKGSKAIELGMTIPNRAPTLRVYLRKYNYPDHLTKDQEKKSYRTKFRRQNRDKKGEFYKKWG